MQGRALRTHLVGTVQWRDLTALSRLEVAHELLLSLPWLFASWVAADHAWYPLALGCSFMFFLTGLRQVHNAFHYALGISRRATDWSMLCLSVLMLGSMHAVQINHLRHHRYCMTAEDVEAMSARLPWWKAILVGPVFPFMLHLKAIEVGEGRQRAWIAAELLLNVLVIGLVFVLLDAPWLEYHVLAMGAGQCLTAFFAVWTVHHDCDDHPFQARTVRGKLKAMLTYNMFFHVEHHLFPAVPTCKLRVLATRLDDTIDNMPLKQVF